MHHRKEGDVIKLNSCKFDMKKKENIPNPEYNQHVKKTFHRRSSRWLNLTNDWIALQSLLKFVAMQA